MERDYTIKKTLKNGEVKEYTYRRTIKGTKKEVSPRQQLRYITNDLNQDMCAKILKFIDDEKKKEIPQIVPPEDGHQ